MRRAVDAVGGVLERDQQPERGPDQEQRPHGADRLEAQPADALHDPEQPFVESLLEGGGLGAGRVDLVVEEGVRRRLQVARRGLHVAEHAEGQHAHHQQRHQPEDRPIGERRRHLRGVVLPELAAAVPHQVHGEAQEALRTAELGHRVADQPLQVRLQPHQRVHARDYRPSADGSPVLAWGRTGEPAPPRPPHPLLRRGRRAAASARLDGPRARRHLRADAARPRAAARGAGAARPRPARPGPAATTRSSRRACSRRRADAGLDLPRGRAAGSGGGGARAHARGAAPRGHRTRARGGARRAGGATPDDARRIGALARLYAGYHERLEGRVADPVTPAAPRRARVWRTRAGSTGPTC